MDGLGRELASLAGSVLFGVGPVALLLALLNGRDRRAAALLERACAALPSATVRSDVAVSVDYPLLAGGGVVTLDMGAASPQQMWSALQHLRRALPGVTLRVVSRLDADSAAPRPELARLEVRRAAG
jgi:hypothetical protein